MTYKLNENNIIITPGKFEREPRWAPYFYDKGCDGEADFDGPDDETLWGFVVTPEDVAQFPELGGVYAVTLEEDSFGFVWTRTLLTQKQYERLKEKA